MPSRTSFSNDVPAAVGSPEPAGAKGAKGAALFSPALFATYLRRFWPVAVAVLAVVVLYPGLPILSSQNVLFPDYSAAEQARLLANKVCSTVLCSAQPMLVAMAAAAPVVALLVFRHLHTRRDIQFSFGLPLSRKAHFATAAGAGYALVAVPFVVGVLVCMGFAGVAGALAEPGVLAALVQLLGCGLGVYLLMFALAALACILAGNPLGAVLVYAGMHAALAGFLVLGNYPVVATMPGLSLNYVMEGGVLWAIPLVKLAQAFSVNYDYAGNTDTTGYPDCSLVDPRVCVVYTVVAVVLLVVAWAAYRIRRAEAAGDTVAFGPVRVVCKVAAALLVSLVLTAIVEEALDLADGTPSAAVLAVLLAMFAAVGWIVAEMVVRRTPRVFDVRSLRSCAVLAACIVLAVAGMKADVGGRVRYVPDPQDVQSVAVDPGWTDRIMADPQDAAELHRYIVEHRDQLQADRGAFEHGYYVATVKFTYQFADGHTLVRSYDIPWPSDGPAGEGTLAAAARSMVEGNPEYVYQTYFGCQSPRITEPLLESASYNEFYLVAGEGVALGAYGDGKTYDEDVEAEYTRTALLSSEDAVGLYEAICRDIAAGNVLSQYGNAGRTSLGYASFVWYEEPFDPNRQTLQEYRNTMGQYYADINVFPNMDYTVAWLTEHGLVSEDNSAREFIGA